MAVRRKVVCADDNSMVNEAVKIHLSSQPELEFAGCATSADDLLTMISNPPPQGVGCPDIVLLDIDMPGKNPFDAISELARICKKARVLMYTGHVRRELIDHALASGAWGYVSKSDGPNALLQAIRVVLNNQVGFSKEVESMYSS